MAKTFLKHCEIIPIVFFLTVSMVLVLYPGVQHSYLRGIRLKIFDTDSKEFIVNALSFFLGLYIKFEGT